MYNILDLLITLRCNAKCLNCIKFCNMKSLTGLDYSDSDMTINQIKLFIQQVKNLNSKPAINTLYITGGEPLLHPLIEEITTLLNKELFNDGYVGNIRINSNMKIIPSDFLKPFIVNFSLPDNNSEIHNTVLLHPNDFNGTVHDYHSCKHYRKNRVVLTYQGYSICCAGDAYIRLFGYEDLILDTLPNSISDFPLDNMKKICMHCPFSNDIVPLEKNEGCPVSKIYTNQAQQNRLHKRIFKKFGG